jgi:hypothetical protein
MNDARPSVALTTSAIFSKVERLFMQAPELRAMRWLVTDNVTNSLAQEWQDPAVSRNTLALLNTLRVHRGAEGCDGQSREPSP